MTAFKATISYSEGYRWAAFEINTLGNSLKDLKAYLNTKLAITPDDQFYLGAIAYTTEQEILKRKLK